jgi:hypothetical protein
VITVQVVSLYCFFTTSVQLAGNPESGTATSIVGDRMISKRSRSHADKETLATIAAAAGAAEDAAVDALHDDMPLGQFTQPVAKKDAPVRSSRTSKPPPRLLEEL